MTGIGTVRREVERAETAAELLNAAYEAFEVMLAAIRWCEDNGAAAVAALAFAAAAAGDGRDAVAAAPSQPARQARPGGGEPAGAGDDAAAVVPELASLAGLLGGKLEHAAGAAATAGDRAACLAAVRQAERIAALLGGGVP